ncbi:hypothetical protein RE6C_05150 [Rhodopirellula europaea 6C]|uniref:Uncharacterized protein n=1 Tax=Rhodopirellula europaea 6C TaxID=1263867 RepID=M2A3Z0_9BACT|nr:hypothetical protein RE6C_05150 [Rhodopirellula europaea 6C]
MYRDDYRDWVQTDGNVYPKRTIALKVTECINSYPKGISNEFRSYHCRCCGCRLYLVRFVRQCLWPSRLWQRLLRRGSCLLRSSSTCLLRTSSRLLPTSTREGFLVRQEPFDLLSR